MGDLFSSDAGVRLACFAGAFTVLAVLELLTPRRPLSTRKPIRWFSNLSLVFLNNLLLRLIAPMGLIGVAWFAESHRWGLLHLVHLPTWTAVVASVIVLDLAIYLQHVMFHAVPLFWRLHRVHHADLDLDVTTGLRFHTLARIIHWVGVKEASIRSKY